MLTDSKTHLSLNFITKFRSSCCVKFQFDTQNANNTFRESDINFAQKSKYFWPRFITRKK